MDCRNEADPPLTRFEWIVFVVAFSLATFGIAPLLVGLILAFSWAGDRIEAAVRRWTGRSIYLSRRQRRRLRRK
jgi:hypothetical protein